MGSCLAHPPAWLFLGWGHAGGLLLKWGRVALEWLGRSPGHCRSPSPAQSRGGCAAGTGQGTGVPAPLPSSLCPGLEGSTKGSACRAPITRTARER